MEDKSSPKDLRLAILKKAFDRAKKQNEAFSLRALAKKLDVSPSFLSKVMTGKSELPLDRVADFVRCLKMDKTSEARLLKTYVSDKIQSVVGTKNSEALVKYEEMGERSYNLLQHWYLIAILDSVSLKDFSIDSGHIAERFGITKAQAEQAVRELKDGGFLVQENGKWVKKTPYFRFPTEKTHKITRAYHAQLIKKASEHLTSQTSPEDFAKRLISGISIAANSEHVPKAIARLNEALFEIAEILTPGPCDEMYQLNVQLFPVTKSRKG